MGMMARKIIVVACIVNSWLNASAPMMSKSGRAIWVLMRRACNPPTRKNANEVQKYRIPIRLWSTVVIQLHSPVSLWGRAKTPHNGRSNVPLAIAHSTPFYLKAVQEGHQGVLLFPSQLEIRHHDVGL